MEKVTVQRNFHYCTWGQSLTHDPVLSEFALLAVVLATTMSGIRRRAEPEVAVAALSGPCHTSQLQKHSSGIFGNHFPKWQEHDFKKYRLKKNPILFSQNKIKNKNKAKDKMNLIQMAYSGTLWLVFCHRENLALITRFMTWWLQLVTGSFGFKSIKIGSHSPNIKFFKKVCNAEWK